MKLSRAFWLVSFSAAFASLGFAFVRPRILAPHPASPDKHQEQGYLGSGACRACHPSEYNSWHQTYHRSMTRVEAELTWDGVESPSLPSTLELYQRRFFVQKNALGQVIVRGPDLHAVGRALPTLSQADDASANWKRNKGEEMFRSAPEVERQLVLITGSHHYLAFWLEGGDDSELRQFPFIYLLDAKRWLPREEAFLQPPEAIPFVARWNANCIQCHAAAGQPRQSEGHNSSGAFWQKYETKVADLGISCEACHGPGSRHVEHYQNPLNRVRASHLENSVAAHVFNPKEARAELGASTCGQCHSYFLPSDPKSWWERGFSHNYRAGEDLSESRAVVNPEDFDKKDSKISTSLAAARESLFWQDGSMIIGGREYNGLLKSPCYEQDVDANKLTCTSCHSMHSSSPNRQLAEEFSSAQNEDSMCTQCHAQIDESHSRHPIGSEGARCVSCHMPRTSYALLQATRSHRITSPQPHQTSPPNACMLCHVSEEQAWFSDQLAAFSDQEGQWPRQSSGQELPWAVELALTGNAVTRAIFADAFGRQGAWKVSGTALSEQVLPLLEKDSYAAVRQIATRSLARVREQRQFLKSKTPSARPSLASDTLLELLSRQDSTPIVISE